MIHGVGHSSADSFGARATVLTEMRLGHQGPRIDGRSTLLHESWSNWMREFRAENERKRIYICVTISSMARFILHACACEVEHNVQ